MSALITTTNPSVSLPSRTLSSATNRIPDKVNSLEELIEGLDQRGLLVVSILLGQQAMKLLTEDKVNASRI